MKFFKYLVTTFSTATFIFIFSPSVQAKAIYDPSFEGRYVDPCPQSYRYVGDEECGDDAKGFVAQMACEKLGYSSWISFRYRDDGDGANWKNWKLFENGQRIFWRSWSGNARLTVLECQ